MTHQTQPRADTRSTEARTILPKDKARQGVTGHNVRYVLGISFVAIVVVFAVIYISFFGV
jgi:hypothetical protein